MSRRRAAIHNGRERDPSATLLAHVACDTAHGMRIIHSAGLERHPIKPRLAPLAQEAKRGLPGHSEAAVERRKMPAVMVLIRKQRDEVARGEFIFRRKST